MTAQRYRVVFAGEILDGLQLQEVKRGLASLFKASEDQIERFFSGKRMAVKKDVDYKTAMKYVKAFERVGAICRMEALETHSSLEQPLMLEREAEKPKQHDLMVCPKCQFEQAPAEECIRCGIIITKFYERPYAPEDATESGGPEADSVAFRGVHRRVVSLSIVIFILSLATVALIGHRDITEEARVGKISFYTDYDQGLDQAYETGKPVMLVFSASWCGACKKMNREVFSNDAVADASKQLVNVYIDVDKADRALLKEYGIKYVPSIFFLDYNGETIIQVADKRSPQDFIDNIDYMAQAHSLDQQI